MMGQLTMKSYGNGPWCVVGVPTARWQTGGGKLDSVTLMLAMFGLEFPGDFI